MASFTINNTQQLFLLTPCKYTSTLHNSFKFHYLSHTHKLRDKNTNPLSVVRTQTHDTTTTITIADLETSSKSRNSRSLFITDSGFSSRSKRVDKNFVEESSNSSVGEEELEKRLNSRQNMGSRSLSTTSKERLIKRNAANKDGLVDDNRRNKNFRKGSVGKVVEEKMEKGSKIVKVESMETKFRVALDMCSKRGDVMTAIKLYDAAKSEGFSMTQYHYGVLLYLCSSAASGVVQPAKSGSVSRTMDSYTFDSGDEVSGVGSDDLDEFREMGKRNSSSMKSNSSNPNNGILIDSGGGRAHDRELSLIQLLNEDSKQNYQSSHELLLMKKGDKGNVKLKNGSDIREDNEILVGGDLKKYALQKGFEIYQKMQVENIPMNEATLTAVARMAMSVGDGDVAFDMVKQMKELGINPRLRSYGPALSAFCSSGNIKQAFAVEEHMLEYGVYPEEPELQALLKASVRANKSDKVYYLLQKLRTSVRKVSPSTADLIQKWFNNKVASGVGKRKWDEKLVKDAIKNGGGGWHGQGWLGRGKWNVSNTTVGGDGLCNCCGVKLETIDLDPIETENFAKSVASIAMRREKHSSFQKFQKWLDYYGPFEAVVDAANVGLYSQNRFIPSKINAVVNGLRQMLPSKKWPLIILHNRRVTGQKMDEAVNKALIEKWNNADALYATPTGSNDDWYWLYAAIKFKCLLVTNDEMRDHTFQLLGNDFFPKWKERHQVHFSFDDVGPVFHMPPPCSVVIQESEIGHWHIPIESEHELEGERTWLCITRANSLKDKHVSAAIPDEEQIIQHNKEPSGRATETEVDTKQPPLNQGKQEITESQPEDIYKNLKTILSSSIFPQHRTVLSEIRDAEELSGCVIDFQI